MNAKAINTSHRLLFTEGGSLLVLFGATQVAELQEETKRRNDRYECPTIECWRCGEMRRDDLDPCSTCDAEAVPF